MKTNNQKNQTLINFMGFMNGITSEDINPNTKELLILMFNMMVELNEKMDLIIGYEDDDEDEF